MLGDGYPRAEVVPQHRQAGRSPQVLQRSSPQDHREAELQLDLNNKPYNEVQMLVKHWRGITTYYYVSAYEVGIKKSSYNSP